ncbi:hypothetical protein PV367_37820 [Streptomyces europaeiscabiei]|uniref:Uncharacterized protein n=1 Tax=Streptomyces europaeiscabiei TaxID=146819 RepID=A0AAJ2PY50_9ACTN|nr:hypothetical protein [Streptomyces europaeiscabiei]MDX3135426.1 hypothetical protein [Streptomyces europaeiscabiei]
MGAQAREDGAVSGSEKSSATGSEETPATGAVRIGDDGRVEHDDGTERQAQDPVPAGEQAAAVTLADATVADMRAAARWTITATAAVGGPLLGGFPPAAIGRSTASATSRRPPAHWPWRRAVRRHPRHPARHPPPGPASAAPGPGSAAPGPASSARPGILRTRPGTRPHPARHTAVRDGGKRTGCG